MNHVGLVNANEKINMIGTGVAKSLVDFVNTVYGDAELIAVYI